MREKAKRVFVISPGRSGTRSLARALEVLGYPNVWHNPPYLDEILAADPAEPVAALEGAVMRHWKFLLGHYGRGGAKFIFSLRDDRSWAESGFRAMQMYPIERFKGTPWFDVAISNRIARWGMCALPSLLETVFDAGTRQTLVDETISRLVVHYHDCIEDVRATFMECGRVDDLLWLPVAGLEAAWEPLCKFLGINEIPKEPFPHVED